MCQGRNVSELFEHQISCICISEFKLALTAHRTHEIIIGNFCPEAVLKNYQPSLSSNGSQTSVKFQK